MATGTTSAATRHDGGGSHDTVSRGSGLRRLTTETKAAYKTTEFIAYVAVLVGILIAGKVVNGAEGGTDPFDGERTWLYVTMLTIGYMISRGIAKAGSREPYSDDSGR